MTPFEVLGVAPTASADEVRRAYLRLARLHHPDVVPAADRPAAEARMRAINEAWAAVRDRAREPGQLPDQGFQPFDTSEPDVDPRDQPDVPYRPGETAPRTSVVPVLLLGAAFVAFAVSAVVRLLPILALGVVLLALAAVGFLALPLLALGRAQKNDEAV